MNRACHSKVSYSLTQTHAHTHTHTHTHTHPDAGVATATPPRFAAIIKTVEAWKPNEGEVVEEMWQKFDEDHDGKVSKKEFQDHWDEAIAPFDKQIRNSMYNYEVENF